MEEEEARAYRAHLGDDDDLPPDDDGEDGEDLMADEALEEYVRACDYGVC